MKTRDLCALAACLAAGASAPAQALPPQRLVIHLERPIPASRPERESALALRSRAHPRARRHVRSRDGRRRPCRRVARRHVAPEAAETLAYAVCAKPASRRRRVEIDRHGPHVEPVPAPSAPLEAASLDEFSHHQWPLMARAPGRAGRANFHGAWQRTTGAAAVVVAVLDSGRPTTRTP